MAGLDLKTTKKSFLWNAIETYAGQVVSFVIGVIMARLLTPSDYGLIGMTTIFTCVAEALIFAGFPTALIRKENCTEKDYSTVFYFNVLVGISLFGVMYVCAPLISEFYKTPALKPICRWMGLLFLVNSLGGVSITILRKEIRFKEIAIITLITSVVTGTIAIILAFKGLGVWALVAQILVAAIMRNIMIWIKANWFPSLIFSKESFKDLFGFGSRLLGANLIVQIYQNIYSLVIGKFYSAASLGYFSRADGYSRLVPINIAGVIQKTLFPLLSKVQNEEETLRNTNLKMIQISSFLIFPACLIMGGLSYPLISVMLSNKWLETAPLLSLLCIAILPDHLYYINNDFITVKGRSGDLMKEQTYSKIFTLVLLAASLPFGLNWIAIGKGIGTLSTYILSGIFLKRSIGIGLMEQIKILSPFLIVSIVIGFADFMIFKILPYTLWWLILILILSVCIYFVAAIIFFPATLKSIKQIIVK